MYNVSFNNRNLKYNTNISSVKHVNAFSLVGDQKKVYF